MPDGKASGEVAFDLGEEPVNGPLTLFVTLPGQPDAPPATFEFEVKFPEKKPQPKPEPAPRAAKASDDTEAVAISNTEPGYNVIEDPSGRLTVEIPPS